MTAMEQNYVITVNPLRMETTVTVYTVTENQLNEIGRRSCWNSRFPGYIPITYAVIAHYFNEPMTTNKLAQVNIMRV